MKTLVIAVFFLALLGMVSVGYSNDEADDPEKAYRIVMHDGSSLVGNIISEDDKSITFKTISGLEMTVPLEQIKSLKPLYGQIRNGKYVRFDPNSTRLLFAPTARALPSGGGYVSLYELFFPFVSVGIGDMITLAGGFSIFPGAEAQLYYFAPKITPFQFENLDLAVGIMHMGITDGSDVGGGIIYTVGTMGSRTAAFTFGLGWGYSGEEVGNKPVVVLGGEVQISNSIKLLTENWFPPDGEFSLISLGIRFFGDNLSTDIGFFMPAGIESDGTVYLPWVNFVYNFGFD